KVPPVALAGGKLAHPIGGEPLGNVVVTGDGHESRGDPPATHSFRQRHRRSARRVSVECAGELVDHDQREMISLRASNRTNDLAAELLATRERVVRSNPRWRRTKSDGGKELHETRSWQVSHGVD